MAAGKGELEGVAGRGRRSRLERHLKSSICTQERWPSLDGERPRNVGADKILT